MDNYRKVEYMLYNYRKTQAEIYNMKLKIKEIEEEYKGTGAISYDEKGSPTNKFNSSVENEIIHKEKEVIMIKDKIRHREIELKKIDNAINVLGEREEKIIRMKYFNKKTNRDIGIELDLTEVHVCRLKKRIINSLITIILN